ncbi:MULTISPECIES: YciI family protein [unclassified Kitasatospora]|uniref:YciI family protein n=1 Tax=unclassified Kitasatospora TaxID=2633591 RepID=UPI00340B3C28
MEYALLVYGQETDWDRMTPEEREARFTANRAFGRELAEAGVRIAYGARLARPAAAEGEARAADGVPEVGGLWVIDVPSDQEALGWAAKLPVSESGRVEVRRCDGPPRTNRPVGTEN